LAASSANEKKVLRFSDCIRTLLSDISTFQHGLSLNDLLWK
jgi:hypothetical protein